MASFGLKQSIVAFALAGYLNAPIDAYGQALNADVPTDQARELSIDAFRSAAERGNARAQNNLGVIYHEGVFGGRYYAEAARWFEAAAAQGNAEAQANLARMFSSGRGGHKDPARAFALASMSAETGFPGGIGTLAGFYWLGIGVEKNVNHAVRLYRQATEKGDAYSAYRLAEYHGIRNLASDRPLIAYYYKLAADRGHAEAQYTYAQFYRSGHYGVTIDEGEAMRWVIRAANKGSSRAQYELGVKLVEGIGLPQDREMGVRWLQIAAARGYMDAERTLAEMNAGEIEITPSMVWAGIAGLFIVGLATGGYDSLDTSGGPMDLCDANPFIDSPMCP